MSAVGTTYSCTLNENTTSVQKKYHNNSNTNNNSPPFTQDSSSMSTVHDDYDFKHIDRSSSFQTSTSSSVDEIKDEAIQRHAMPDISSLSFYSGPSLNNNGLNSKKHANHLRKSIVISPSLNSVKSVVTYGSTDSKILDMSFDADQEIPTRTMGIVESPSIQALSDILTNRISTSCQSKRLEFGSIKEEEEPDENDASTISQNQRQISLIDDIYTPMQFNRNQSVGTFYTANSTDTIKANYNDQPDLINLSSPVESTTPVFGASEPINKNSNNENFIERVPIKQSILKQNINANKRINMNNYEDIFETFVPQNSTSNKKLTDQEKNSNTYSINKNDMISPAFSEFASPALGFNEPVQNFQLMNSNGLMHKSISKLSNRSDSIYEIGYDDGDDGFSFIPSEYDSDEPQVQYRFSKNNKTTNNDDTDKEFEYANVSSFNEYNETLNQKEQESLEQKSSPFIRRHSHRLSMRMVKDSTYEDLHETGFIEPPDRNESAPSPEKPYVPSGETPRLLPTPKMVSVPILHPSTNTPVSSSKFGSSPEISSKVAINNMHFSSSPSLLHSSPIRNSSPTFESILSSPKISSPKPIISLSPQKEENRPLNFKQTSRPIPKPTPVQPKIEKMKEEKHKNKKITFKGLFKKNTNEKSNSATNSSYSTGLNGNLGSHKKSFSFNNLDTFSDKTEHSEKKKERKEKTRSLLSGWKRKSFSFAQPLEESKQKLFSKNTFVDANSDNNLTPSDINNHVKSKNSNNSSSKALSSKGQIPSPSGKPATSSPKEKFSFHSHTISNSASKIHEKVLPSLPHPSAQPKRPLLQTYGFDKTPKLNQSPVLSTPLNVQHEFKSTSPAWSSNPKINRSESYQTVQTEVSPVKLASPLTADFIESSPNPKNNKALNNDQKTQDIGDSEIINTSSNYDSIDIEDLQPPSFSASLNLNSSSPRLALGIQTPRTQHSFDTPTSDTVASFTASPNRYHIGDDMFPKHLGINEIESIVSLERSRSMRSIRSSKGHTPSIVSNRESQSLSHKNSILKKILDNEEDFHQLMMPDGMIVVRSPQTEQTSTMSSDHGASRKTSSILKKPSRLSENSQKTFLSNNGFNSHFGNNDVSRASLDFENSDMDNDMDDMIRMINFDQSDENLLDTEFNLDNDFNNQTLNESKSNYSIPDFIGNIDAPYDSDYFDDLDSFNGDNHYSKTSDSTTFDKPIPVDAKMQQRITPVGSIDDIIKEEECYTKSNYSHNCQRLPGDSRYAYVSKPNNETDCGNQSSDRPISMSFKGLRGPTFNSSLKPATQSAIIGSLTHQPAVDVVVPSDSENSISHMSQTYEDSKYHVNNPFREKLHDDYLENDHNNDYNEERNSDGFRPKSIGNQFMQKLNNNHFGHFSVNSLPTVVINNTEEKPSKLTKKRSKSASSFSKLTMFGNSLMHNRDEEEEKPKVKFSSRILLYDTYGEDEYDRKPETATCNNLTPQLALDIKNELNEVKSEMAVHELSRCYTHFF